MSEQDDTQALSRHHPVLDDKEAWKAYWKEQGQPWRTEPEVDRERQHQLMVYQVLQKHVLLLVACVLLAPTFSRPFLMC